MTASAASRAATRLGRGSSGSSSNQADTTLTPPGVAGTDNRLWIEPTENSALPARFPATALLVDVGRREELTGPGVWGIRSMIPRLELGSPYGQPKVPGCEWPVPDLTIHNG